MKKLIAAVLAVSAIAATTPAMAQAWQSINQRQANLDRRIDQGVRSGSLTRQEAANLRTLYRGIVQLEARYRATNGLSAWERRDLDQRFDHLSSRVRYGKNNQYERRR